MFIFWLKSERKYQKKKKITCNLLHECCISVVLRSWSNSLLLNTIHKLRLLDSFRLPSFMLYCLSFNNFVFICHSFYSAEELKYRNSLLPPHLRSTYAAQYDSEITEDELKVSPDLISNLSNVSHNNFSTPSPPFSSLPCELLNDDSGGKSCKHHHHHHHHHHHLVQHSNSSKHILHTSQLSNISSIESSSSTPKTIKTLHSTPLLKKKMHPNISRIINHLK